MQHLTTTYYNYVHYRYGLTIVEDDAYYYMQHRAADPNAAVPGLSGLGPSYLSMDTDGRVVRLDTLSRRLTLALPYRCLSPDPDPGLALTPTLIPKSTALTLTLALPSPQP
jgi:hypothetical protein